MEVLEELQNTHLITSTSTVWMTSLGYFENWISLNIRNDDALVRYTNHVRVYLVPDLAKKKEKKPQKSKNPNPKNQNEGSLE